MPDFHKLQIVYDVNSPGGLASVNEPATSVRPASLTDSSQPAPLPMTHLRLECQAPYPGVHEDFVHVTLRVIQPGSEDATSGPPPGLRGFSNANSRGGGLMSMSAGPPVYHGPKPGDECLVIDVPKSELSNLFVDLANDGFFQQSQSQPAMKNPQSHLGVMYDQGFVNKAWNREPQLERLVDLLKRHGTPTIMLPPQGGAAGPMPGYYTGRYGKS